MERKLIYSMGVSLDGFIAARNGEIDWTVPDEELHRFHNHKVSELGAHFCGRGLYEVMEYWETAEETQELSDYAREFAQIWKALPKVVVSTTLDVVHGEARLIRDRVAEEVTRLKQQPGKDLAAGGAGLAASLTRLGLIDEYHLFIHPVVLGAGTPYWPPVEEHLELELIETRTFSSRVIYARYRRR